MVDVSAAYTALGLSIGHRKSFQCSLCIVAVLTQCRPSPVTVLQTLSSALAPSTQTSNRNAAGIASSGLRSIGSDAARALLA